MNPCPHLSSFPLAVTAPPLPHNHARYDALGNRVRKLTSSSVDYLYDLSGSKITEINSSGGWNRGEVYAAGLHLATYANSTTYFNHADWLGTERARTNLSGALCETTASLAFGDGQTISGSCADTSPLHFTGYERDGETGLDFAVARHYGSNLGRFMSPDPLSGSPGNPQSWNRYAYVYDNPLNGTDPSGMCGEEDNWSGCNWDDWNFWNWNYGVILGYGGGWDPSGLQNNYSYLFANPIAQPWWTNPAAMNFPQGNVWDFLWGSLIGFAQSFGNWTDNIPDPKFRAFAIQQNQPKSTAEENGRKIGPALGFFIPGLQEEEVAMEGIEAAESARYLYYYTDEATAELISGSQLGREGFTTYLTTEGNLSALQAQLELALPQKNSAITLFRVSTEGLEPANFILQRRVTGNVFNRPGGGWEVLYKGPISLKHVIRIR